MHGYAIRRQKRHLFVKGFPRWSIRLKGPPTIVFPTDVSCTCAAVACEICESTGSSNGSRQPQGNHKRHSLIPWNEYPSGTSRNEHTSDTSRRWGKPTLLKLLCHKMTVVVQQCRPRHCSHSQADVGHRLHVHPQSRLKPGLLLTA